MFTIKRKHCGFVLQTKKQQTTHFKILFSKNQDNIQNQHASFPGTHVRGLFFPLTLSPTVSFKLAERGVHLAAGSVGLPHGARTPGTDADSKPRGMRRRIRGVPETQVISLEDGSRNVYQKIKGDPRNPDKKVIHSLKQSCKWLPFFFESFFEG